MKREKFIVAMAIKINGVLLTANAIFNWMVFVIYEIMLIVLRSPNCSKPLKFSFFCSIDQQSYCFFTLCVCVSLIVIFLSFFIHLYSLYVASLFVQWSLFAHNINNKREMKRNECNRPHIAKNRDGLSVSIAFKFLDVALFFETKMENAPEK